MDLNARAWRVCQELEAAAATLRVRRVEEGLGWDFGNQCEGGLQAGIELARICMADLADIRLVPSSLPGSGLAVQVVTDAPFAACIESQYAGWKISDGDYFAMGSGPMRVAAAHEAIFAGRAAERAEQVVGVLEANRFPPAAVVQQLAEQCRVTAENVCLLVAPTASIAGTLQIVARSIETTMHKLMELGFDLQRVISGFGLAPLPPIAHDDMTAIGWTNDAILYGAEVTLWVRGDDDSLADVISSVPSCSSTDYGRPFGEIFARYEYDFYKIDHHLFSPAAVRFVNLDSGRSFAAGQVDGELLRSSIWTVTRPMEIGVLTWSGSWYWRDLQRAASTRAGLHLHCLSFDSLTARLDPAPQVAAREHSDLSELAAVIVRSMPPGSLEQVVFRMNALHRLSEAGTPVINSPRCLEIAIDKYLALAQLQAAGLPVPRTRTSQGWEQAMIDFHALGGDVVVKPIFGGEGRGIMRVTDEAMAWRVFRSLSQLGNVIYQQQFIQHEGADLRVLLIGDRAYGMRRLSHDDWRTNVSRGARTEPIQIDDQLHDLAARAAESVGADVVGVDVLPGRDGRRYLLEVNAVPGWHTLSRTLSVDIAGQLLDVAMAGNQ